MIRYTAILFLISIFSIYAQQSQPSSNNQLDSIENARNTKKYPHYKWHIFTGGLFSDVDGSVIVNNSRGVGSRLDFEDDLKLDDFVTTYRVGAIYDFNEKHSLAANFFVLNRKSSIILQDSIDFGENRYNANADFDFEVDFTYIGINYTYNLLSHPQFKTGATAGIRLFDIKFAGTGTVTVNNETSVKSTEESVLAPGLLLGLNYIANFSPKLVNRATVEYFSVKVGDITATLFETRIGLEYYFVKNVGFGLMAFANVIKVISDSQEDFNGEVKYNFKGLSLFAAVRF